MITTNKHGDPPTTEIAKTLHVGQIIAEYSYRYSGDDDGDIGGQAWTFENNTSCRRFISSRGLYACILGRGIAWVKTRGTQTNTESYGWWRWGSEGGLVVGERRHKRRLIQPQKLTNTQRRPNTKRGDIERVRCRKRTPNKRRKINQSMHKKDREYSERPDFWTPFLPRPPTVLTFFESSFFLPGWSIESFFFKKAPLSTLLLAIEWWCHTTWHVRRCTFLSSVHQHMERHDIVAIACIYVA